MISIKRIICPVDLSENSERTLRYALALARTYEASLYVCHRPENVTLSDQAGVADQVGQLINAALHRKGETSAATGNLQWQSVILEGEDIGEEIVRVATRLNADLILMRSRRRPWAATLLGSTAESVAHHAPCSVLVMHADEREWMEVNTGEIRIKRLLVAYDFSVYSEAAFQYGLALAQQYQAEVHLLHILPTPIGEPETAWVGVETDTPYHQAARRLQEAVPKEVHLWSQVTHIVRTGRVYAEILDYLGSGEIDLVCMGAHGSDFTISSLLGSNVDRVLRQARCPVLIAPVRP
jgi:nucleotide-binding universal stress UspA family protein